VDEVDEVDDMDRMDGMDDEKKRLNRVLRGEVSFWVECWGRSVQLYVVEISKWIDACARRPSVTWLEVEQGVERILSRRDAAPELPRRRAAECLPSPQQEDAGGVDCGTDPAPSVGEDASAKTVLCADSICVRPLGRSEELFEVLLGVRGVVLTRAAVAEFLEEGT
jgi:hypothetical protein